MYRRYTYRIIDTIHKPTEYACVQARKCSGLLESAALFTKKATGVFMHLPIAASCSQAQERNATCGQLCGTVEINGTLPVAICGTVEINGALPVTNCGTVEINGALPVAICGTVEINGTLPVANCGTVEINGTLPVANCGTVEINGTLPVAN